MSRIILLVFSRTFFLLHDKKSFETLAIKNFNSSIGHADKATFPNGI